MPKAGRNQTCSCGSGIKAKRCCGVARGPSEDQLARAFLHEQAVEWAPLLIDHTDDELHELVRDVSQLARVSITLHLLLPPLLPPVLERLRRAIDEGDEDAMRAAMPDAIAAVDTPSARARLVRGILELHDDDHRIDCDMAAYAIVDLAQNRRSAALAGALVRTLAVQAGAVATPSGLLVGAH